jgi:hypothetical protein
MMDETRFVRRDEELTLEELEQQQVAELPDREAMALVDANVAIPINLALAANVLTEDSIAFAQAMQDADIDQST